MNDNQAIGAISVINELKYKIPEDVAVLGYDDIKVSEYLGLSTISQNCKEMGRKGIMMLIDSINNKHNQIMSYTVMPSLCERKTIKTLNLISLIYS